jgi:hypothetical protein
MKKCIQIYVVLITVLTLIFLFNQCGSSQEKTGEKAGDTKQIAVQEASQEQEIQETGIKEKGKKRKSRLPKRLINLGLTDEQLAKCEAAYKEIFTPEIIAKRKELRLKLKGVEKGSDEFKKLKEEIAKELKPYNKQFNVKLKEILTEEQKGKYFIKRKSKM